MVKPSGTQYEIRHGEHRAVVVEVGGALRAYDVGDVEVIDGFHEEAMCDGCRGTSLLPWPNRVRDGRYSWDGKDYQLNLTEPSKHNASHGLTRWVNWGLQERSESAVRIGYVIHAQSGWPFLLDCTLAYELSEAGLIVTTTITNVGAQDAPVAAGAHPYLSAGGSVDGCVLTVPADRYLPADERGIPTGIADVEGTGLDFRTPRLIGEQPINQGYTGVHRNGAGEVVIRLERPDGQAVEMWCGDGYEHLQVYTGDDLAGPQRRRGVAAEPMTAATNALQTGDGLRRLTPGESLALQWGVRLAGPSR